MLCQLLHVVLTRTPRSQALLTAYFTTCGKSWLVEPGNEATPSCLIKKLPVLSH